MTEVNQFNCPDATDFFNRIGYKQKVLTWTADDGNVGVTGRRCHQRV